jgi:hypothetical protein
MAYQPRPETQALLQKYLTGGTPAPAGLQGKQNVTPYGIGQAALQPSDPYAASLTADPSAAYSTYLNTQGPDTMAGLNPRVGLRPDSFENQEADLRAARAPMSPREFMLGAPMQYPAEVREEQHLANNMRHEDPTDDMSEGNAKLAQFSMMQLAQKQAAMNSPLTVPDLPSDPRFKDLSGAADKYQPVAAPSAKKRGGGRGGVPDSFWGEGGRSGWREEHGSSRDSGFKGYK